MRFHKHACRASFQMSVRSCVHKFVSYCAFVNRANPIKVMSPVLWDYHPSDSTVVWVPLQVTSIRTPAEALSVETPPSFLGSLLHRCYTLLGLTSCFALQLLTNVPMEPGCPFCIFMFSCRTLKMLILNEGFSKSINT